MPDAGDVVVADFPAMGFDPTRFGAADRGRKLNRNAPSPLRGFTGVACPCSAGLRPRLHSVAAPRLCMRRVLVPRRRRPTAKVGRRSAAGWHDAAAERHWECSRGRQPAV